MDQLRNDVATGTGATDLAGRESDSDANTQSAAAYPVTATRMSILVTGGAGYIGSHTYAKHLLAGHAVVILDNLNGQPVPHRLSPRRPGAAASCHAEPALAEQLSEWKSVRDLVAMRKEHWRWQKRYPQGYV